MWLGSENRLGSVIIIVSCRTLFLIERLENSQVAVQKEYDDNQWIGWSALWIADFGPVGSDRTTIGSIQGINSIYYSNEINRLIDIISIYTADQQMEWPSRPSIQQVSNSGQTTETRPARTQETVPSSEFAILFDPVAWRHLASLCRPSEWVSQPSNLLLPSNLLIG